MSGAHAKRGTRDRVPLGSMRSRYLLEGLLMQGDQRQDPGAYFAAAPVDLQFHLNT